MRHRARRPARKICISQKKPPGPRLSKSYGGFQVALKGGPLDGVAAWLHCTMDTLPIELRGHRGQYIKAEWVPA